MNRIFLGFTMMKSTICIQLDKRFKNERIYFNNNFNIKQ